MNQTKHRLKQTNIMSWCLEERHVLEDKPSTKSQF